MNRHFHLWLDNHEIVKLFLMVALVATPSILLCVVGLLIAMNLDADVSHRNNGWWLFGTGVISAVFSRFHYLYHGRVLV